MAACARTPSFFMLSGLGLVSSFCPFRYHRGRHGILLGDEEMSVLELEMMQDMDRNTRVGQRLEGALSCTGIAHRLSVTPTLQPLPSSLPLTHASASS